ncbi:plasmid replication protein RepC [Ensifer sp. SL37]|uniref:plasmid replication protein RepC n=1 Tax=Ensifer sp. SL37 TaxID=2995137 RepID=UPI00227312BE|nr:plasmid replication protein RepC [Ensifer sp. SL37]MCY1740618.1 plasmid replication protein RepC [Ensifer sp. SL37]
MQSGHVTTPFGRRAMTLALVKNQFAAADIEQGKSVDKWKVYQHACAARTLLGLRDRALAVLSALLSFYPNSELSEASNLIVFPSNAQLTARANGIAGTTLRENLAHLVQAGLIYRNDSPNGKRYARKGRDGVIDTAYGFSLAPLLARADEIARLAQQVNDEHHRLKVIREKVTIARRDVRKLISAAIEEGARGNWEAIEAQYVAVLAKLKMAKTSGDHADGLDELTLLQEGITNLLEIQLIPQKSDTNDNVIRQHIHNSNTESTPESEPSSENELEAKPWLESQRRRKSLKAFPLSMVLRACPQIADYGNGGQIENWRELMSAAVVVRSMLGVSPSAYQQACEVMGPENAAVATACILERAGHINSPGGYLRDLTSRAERGEFSLGPMLMALMRSTGAGLQSAS